MSAIVVVNNGAPAVGGTLGKFGLDVDTGFAYVFTNKWSLLNYDVPFQFLPNSGVAGEGVIISSTVDSAVTFPATAALSKKLIGVLVQNTLVAETTLIRTRGIATVKLAGGQLPIRGDRLRLKGDNTGMFIVDNNPAAGVSHVVCLALPVGDTIKVLLTL